MSSVFNLIGSTLRLSMPILFVALGALVMQLAGIVCMGSEGMMITGAFTAVAVSLSTNNIWLGFLAAILVTGLIGIFFGFLSVKYRVNQVVLGVALNLLCAGVTTTLNRGLFGSTAPMLTVSFPDVGLGLLAPDIIGFVSIPVMWVFLYKTLLGLRIRSVGENPLAVQTSGLSVAKISYIACFISGAFVGMGGAFFSTGRSRAFIEGMTGGRGYIALAAVAFGKYNPVGTFLAVLLFGFGEAVQYRLQAGGDNVIPHQFALMLPYVLTVVALSVFVRKSKDPAALGKPFKSE